MSRITYDLNSSYSWTGFGKYLLQAQNAPEALPYLELIDDDDPDEIIEFNPSHPTIVWLRQKGWQ